jgi:hypothetical protein
MFAPKVSESQAAAAARNATGNSVRPNKPRLPDARKAVPPSRTPPFIHQVLTSPGQPLESGLRGFMEARFGRDFSGVRVHSDEAAGLSASALSANAYTAGQNIVFGAGKFAPDQAAGRKLLAHELAHVVQQSRPGTSAESQRHCEQDADDAAGAIGSGDAAAVRTSAVWGGVQRQPVTEPVGGRAVPKKSRLVRIERYWRSPSARAFFADGTNEEVTFVEAPSLDPTTRPAGPFQKVVALTIDRSSPIRPHVEFASRSSGSKVQVMTRLSPADRIATLPANVRGELSEGLLSDTDNESNAETMEFAADVGDRLKETGGTTKIEMTGRDPATVTRMQAVDQWVAQQKSNLDKLGSMHRAKFTHLLSDIRQVGVTGTVAAEDLDVQDIELVLAGVAGGQSDFQTFSEFERGMKWRLRSGRQTVPEEHADNPDFYIRTEYRKAWKTEAVGLHKMSRIAAAAQVAPFAALGVSAAIGTGGALLEVAGEGFATWTAARGISNSLVAKWLGASMFGSGAVSHFASARDEARTAGMDPNSPSGIANTAAVSLLRASGLGEVVENVENKSMLTQQDLKRSPFERIWGGALGAANAVGTFGAFVPEAPRLPSKPAITPEPATTGAGARTVTGPDPVSIQGGGQTTPQSRAGWGIVDPAPEGGDVVRPVSPKQKPAPNIVPPDQVQVQQQKVAVGGGQSGAGQTTMAVKPKTPRPDYEFNRRLPTVKDLTRDPSMTDIADDLEGVSQSKETVKKGSKQLGEKQQIIKAGQEIESPTVRAWALEQPQGASVYTNAELPPEIKSIYPKTKGAAQSGPDAIAINPDTQEITVFDSTSKPTEHMQKTVRDAQMLKDNLPPRFKGYKVFAQEGWTDGGLKYSPRKRI